MIRHVLCRSDVCEVELSQYFQADGDTDGDKVDRDDEERRWETA